MGQGWEPLIEMKTGGGPRIVQASGLAGSKANNSVFRLLLPFCSMLTSAFRYDGLVPRKPLLTG